MVNTTCSRIEQDPASTPIVGSWTFQKLMTVVGGACAVATIVICLLLITLHVLNRGYARQQKLMLRIIFLPLSWSIFAFFGILKYNVAPFIDPIPQLLEAIAVAALFELFISYVVPNRSEREAFFRHADNLDSKGRKIDNTGSLSWFQSIYLRVYQLPLVFILVTIVNEGLAIANCPDNKIYGIVSVVVQIVSGVATAICLLAIIRFVRRFKHELKPHRAVTKIACLKGIVGLTVTQKFIINMLNRFGGLKSTDTASVWDYKIGLNDFLIEVEMFLAALSFTYAFNHLPYRRHNMAPNSEKKMSTVRFILEGLYFPDLFVGLYDALKYLGHLQSGNRQQQSYQAYQSYQTYQPYQYGGQPMPDPRRQPHDSSYDRLVDGYPPNNPQMHPPRGPPPNNYGATPRRT